MSSATATGAAGPAGAVAELDEPDALRRAARGIRQRVLAELPDLLEQFADAVLDRGGHVCWATTASDARHYVAGLVVRHNARRVVKARSMVTEEIDLDRAVEACQAKVVEADLGEWIVQLADEAPSHLVAPAWPRSRRQVHDLFVERAEAQRSSGTAPDTDDLVRYARERLRAELLDAEIGVTGANLAVAETGSVVLVTSEGNARLVTALPRVHVVVLGMDRLLADWSQADLLLALLARSATGQRLSSSTTVLSGPRSHDEWDGPDELHVVILDNGRSQVLGIEPHDLLTCIRCGAGVDDQTRGGLHPAEPADGWTLCGACLDACPTEVPLQDALLSLRRATAPEPSRVERTAWRLWSAAWSDARRYGLTTRAESWSRWATRLGGHLPIDSTRGDSRDVPEPTAARFRDLWWRGRI
jgi:L-lactate dehydrogenase complex protein LldF